MIFINAVVIFTVLLTRYPFFYASLYMRKKKILIADDDEGIVDALCMILEAMGYDVEFTYDGGQVMAAVNNKPDLILLDIWMCGHDGRDICKMLKSNNQYKSIPILMISASRNIGQSALEAGANDFMEKPFEMDTLLLRINQLLKEEVVEEAKSKAI